MDNANETFYFCEFCGRDDCDESEFGGNGRDWCYDCQTKHEEEK